MPRRLNPCLRKDERGRAIDNILEMPSWQPGIAPVAVIMISLNEAHNMEAVLENLKGWAQEVFLLDSYSQDETVDIALRYGVHVVQRRFRGFGDQWNFALDHLPITAPWTMKLDPDERLTDELKANIAQAIVHGDADGLEMQRHLWFMGRPLPIRQKLNRVWHTGRCRFSEVLVNEHPIVQGKIVFVDGDMEHHDSPNLHHWFDKQNFYTTEEAISIYQGDKLADKPKLLGSPFQRRMWFKKHYRRIPFRYILNYIYYLIIVRFWSTGYEGIAWARLRVFVRRSIEDKLREMINLGKPMALPERNIGQPDLRVKNYNEY